MEPGKPFMSLRFAKTRGPAPCPLAKVFGMEPGQSIFFELLA
jgi:hypothetical protein